MNGYVYMLLTAMCWSFAGVFIRFNSQPAFIITFVNAVIGILFNLFFQKQRMRLSKLIFLAAISQFFMGMTFILANQFTTIGNTIVLQYTSMIFILIFQCIEKKRLPHKSQIFIILTVILGMYLFFIDSLSLSGMIGNALAIVSGIFYSLQFYLNSKEGAHPYSSMMTSFVLSLCLFPFVMTRLQYVMNHEWGAMLMSGIICAGVGSYCFSKGIQRVNAFGANIICMSEVIFAPLWALLIFDETLTALSLLGAIMIIGSIVVNMILESRERFTLKKELT